ncbi:response regulator [Maioricimonas rarisocia]|nr:response regulator [Maioricimonas rarisocia]
MTDGRSKRVLLVQESPTQAQALGLTLEEAGFDVEIVSDVGAALESLRRQPFELVVTALSLPGRNGLELCRAIRSTPEWHAIAVMTLVGVRSVSQILESLAAGADGYVRKNRSPEAALVEIRSVLQRRSESATPLPQVKKVVFRGRSFDVPTEPDRLISVLMSSLADLSAFIPEPSVNPVAADVGDGAGNVDADEPVEPAPLRVLLVDDSATNRTLGRALLSSAGHAVETANNGVEAVDLATTRPFDVILMDVEMPEMDGLDATRAIRRQEARTANRIPVFAMSAHSSEADHQRCLDAGMDSCLAKPIRIAEVESALSSVADSCSHASSAPPGSDGGPELVDWEIALENMDGDDEILQEVIQETIEETPELLAQLKHAAANGDGDEVGRLAHTIKSAGQTFAADRLSQQAEELETPAPSAQPDGADPRIRELIQTTTAFLEELRQRQNGTLLAPGQDSPG